MLNIHHLELFYHVARAGGISRAVKLIPYGIQQPAVSGQLLQLERDLGVRLFERSPFRLTAAGEELWAFVQPFFGGLDGMETKLREKPEPVLRIGAAEIALRYHIPPLLERLRVREPKLRLSLRSGFQTELEAWLEARTIDLAVTPLDRRPPRRIRVQPLVKIPLVLLVPKKSSVRSAEELWRQRTVETPLIALPESESVVRRFRRGLQQHGVQWPTAIEASSLEAITAFVASGYGIGVSVGLPELTRESRLRALALDDFAPLEIAALWLGEPGPLVAETLEVARAYVRKAWPQWECAG